MSGGLESKTVCPRYLNAEIDPAIVKPGDFLKATLDTQGFPAGSYEVLIELYDAKGDFLKEEWLTLFVDNHVPAVQIADITLAGAPVNISGTGCTIQTLRPDQLSGDLSVRYRVDHANGAILSYKVGVLRCNESGEFPVNHGGGGEPSFHWVHDSSVDCETRPNFYRGTPYDPTHDGTGFVTTTLAPRSPWLGDGENFTILRVSVSCQWRATDGHRSILSTSDGPRVWGIQK